MSLFEVITIGPFYMIVTALIGTALIEFSERTGLAEYPHAGKVCLLVAFLIATAITYMILNTRGLPLDATL